ncbi:hypothetical protein BAE44_0014186 [Dichanthelium oligosanthes]|uniref:KIB1-4 beta-propeller domain-containing protein n=1 Tax=Dichanthelium oligosanthes TaxID=888268 RepID=A0A1E5VI52_9POAL|nr:hypothetical protein BAE44_0014186 [Dichanthelium oligosanthes]
MKMAADVVGAGSPRLVLLYNLFNELKFFIADPETEQFYVVSPDTSTGSVELAPSLQCRDMSAESDAHEAALVPIVSSFLAHRRLAVKIGPGEMLQVCRSPQQGVCLFRMSSPGRKMERVYSIGGRALFLGDRFISIHADSFPSINANCIYYKQEEDGSTHVYMYDLAHDVEERIAESNDHSATR